MVETIKENYMSDNTYFSPEVDAALKGWISVETWFKGHATDEQRFDKFVKALAAFAKQGGGVGDIEETLRRAFADLYPAQNINNFSKKLADYAAKAEKKL